MSVIGAALRRATSWWPRSEAERFADRMWPDRLAPQDVSTEPLIGDDSFHYFAPAAGLAGARPAGESEPPTTPPAGHPDPPFVTGSTPAAESAARSSAAGRTTSR